MRSVVELKVLGSSVRGEIMVAKLQFYKEERLKFVEELGCEIPEDWEVKPLKKLFDVKTGTTPDTKNKEYWEDGDVNWLTPTDLSKLNGKTHISDSERKITKKALKDYNLNILPKGSIIISTRAPVGYVAVLDVEATFNQGCKGLVPRVQLNPDYYCYYLRSIRNKLESLSGGSTFRELSKKMLEELIVPEPPLQEQKAIAEILSTVDKAIEKTDEIIAKTERLKKGLMQELLTGRVRVKVENGKISFYKETRFKDTEIGKVPEDWEVVRLGKIGDFQYGITVSAKEEDTGVKLLRITDIKNGGIIDWSEVPYCEISTKELSKYALKVGDILFARIGATTGKTCYIDREVTAVFGSYLIRFLPKSGSEIDTKFLFFFTQSQQYWSQVDKLKGGQLKKGLNTRLLAELRLPLPPLQEQKAIAEILSTVDRKLEIERKEKERLERIKKGLMDVLLTGKIRVKV